ncbi:hypothetical protein [Ornithinibacillus halophilus]|uniref:Type II secretory pathway, pseudopilin PulG n=1 Tax=Ornithinibacillus halophilus TaxID=930117 RepID=A0A1M5EI07_9BACI|nr:hypothetical protein [Ornithinibacillus halophilus]SHF78879.1 hypothetical protein SAMN05216225_100533 [Ornithinibacillus halophilus]
MNSFKNETGAALVLTIMIITLFLLFLMTLFFQITNTTKQITTIEENLVAEQIAEMGVDYYHAYIEKNLPDTISDIEELDISSGVLLNHEVELDDNYSFFIDTTSIDEEANKIYFTVTAVIDKAKGKQSNTNSTITINVVGSESEE